MTNEQPLKGKVAVVAGATRSSGVDGRQLPPYRPEGYFDNGRFRFIEDANR